ncbi:hypothetical protein D5F53_33190 (plasmid) [Paenibacillus lautus]|uniref:Uncharacterized protein n=1 Tax=Paenibacillus lautus TaxID=1401 RepID=A0A385TV86_PAELA|nr:hypothetical protein D5F53_33190 [Paenibacillus lautus]
MDVKNHQLSVISRWQDEEQMMINVIDMLLYMIGRMHITLSKANCTLMRLWEIRMNYNKKELFNAVRQPY